jgi:hypothetical protein
LGGRLREWHGLGRLGKSGEGDPILAAFESDEGGVRDSAVGLEILEVG